MLEQPNYISVAFCIQFHKQFCSSLVNQWMPFSSLKSTFEIIMQLNCVWMFWHSEREGWGSGSQPRSTLTVMSSWAGSLLVSFIILSMLGCWERQVALLGCGARASADPWWILGGSSVDPRWILGEARSTALAVPQWAHQMCQRTVEFITELQSSCLCALGFSFYFPLFFSFVFLIWRLEVGEECRGD